MKVDVYWNIRKKCFSVRHKGKVIEHVPYIALEDVEFVVQPGGNARVRHQRRKNVHAFARGHRVYHVADDLRTGISRAVTYNPYDHTTFVESKTLVPVHSAPYALFTTRYSATTNNHNPNVSIP
jgi:hypothetical protein